jgi:hypothetical protein
LATILSEQSTRYSIIIAETELRMNTEPRIRNWASWTIVCPAAALVVTLLVVEYAKDSDFRKAAEWHKVHGNLILVDGHKLSLPQDWWEKYPPADGKQVSR